MEIRLSEDAEEAAEACSAILDGLPEWFGNPDALADYIMGIPARIVYFAEHDGAVVGLLALKAHFGVTAEVWLLAVERSRHRQGVGKALMGYAEKASREAGCPNMVVMATAGSHYDSAHAGTRAFFEACGYAPLLEVDDQFGDDPKIWMLKSLAA